jgi:hypothetical protein
LTGAANRRRLARMSDPIFPDDFRRIELVAARDPDHPEGDSGHALSLIAVLSADGHLDGAGWSATRERWRVVRHHEEAAGRIGHLVRLGSGWAIHWGASDDVDQGFRFGAERFVPGEYVSIAEDEGMRTYRVAAVRPIA